MALKVLMLRKKISEKKEALNELRKAAESFETREAELEQAIAEAETDEQKAVVEEAVDNFEAEKQKNRDDQSALQAEIEAAENEIREIEENAPKADPKEQRKEIKKLETRMKFFGMNNQERDAFFGNQDVKDFLERTRELGKQKRAITGAELLIPTVVLELVKESALKYSKLMKHVNVRNVPGKARQNIMGSIPEAVWTEMCATLNELSLSFGSVEVDGYKVGGYIAVCNATLEDSDIALASEIISALGQAIGYALDKAILYGTGTKMPLGIVTRLAQTTKPTGYPATSRPWADLHTTNIQTITAANSTGVKLFQNVLKGSGAAKNKYTSGAKFWAMNETTYTTMMSEALTINASGAVVTGMSQTMPILGGAIEILDFIPDNNIIGGYGDLYLLAERAGTTIAQSEHVRFIEDQTVFKATARYDGLPVIPEGFVVFGLNATTPTTSMSFAEDVANKVEVMCERMTRENEKHFTAIKA